MDISAQTTVLRNIGKDHGEIDENRRKKTQKKQNVHSKKKNLTRFFFLHLIIIKIVT